MLMNYILSESELLLGMFLFCDILPVMNDGASYEARLVVVGSESNEVCSSR